MSVDVRPSRLNVFEMTIEQNKPDYLFNPDHDIAQEDWRKIIEFGLVNKKSEKDLAFEDFMMVAFAANIVSPKRREEFGLDMELFLKADRSFAYYDVATKIYCLARLALLYPNLTQALNESHDIDKINLTDDDLKSPDDYWHPVSIAFAKKVFDRQWDPPIELHERIQSALPLVYPIFIHWAILASHDRILYPQHYSFPSDDIWDRARVNLNGYKKAKQWLQFVALAAYLSILSAEKIELGEDGLHLSFHKEEINNQLPQERSF